MVWRWQVSAPSVARRVGPRLGDGQHPEQRDALFVPTCSDSVLMSHPGGNSWALPYAKSSPVLLQVAGSAAPGWCGLSPDASSLASADGQSAERLFSVIHSDRTLQRSVFFCSELFEKGSQWNLNHHHFF